MNPDVLRVCVAGMAAVVSGSMLGVMGNYVVASIRRGTAAGSLLVRHVIAVTGGVLGLVATAGAAVFDALPNVDLAWPDPNTRLILYLISMALLLVALVELGRHTRRRRKLCAATQGSATRSSVPPVGRHREVTPRWRRSTT